METEIMKTKTYEENLLEQEIPIEGTFKSLEQVIEKRISMETIERLNQQNYMAKYKNPLSQQAQAEVTKYIKRNRPEGEVEFTELKRIIGQEKIDKEEVTEDIDYSTYQMLQRGEYSNISENILSKVRGVFAQASQKFNSKLRESVSSTDIFNMLYQELSNKKREDYYSLVWQL